MEKKEVQIKREQIIPAYNLLLSIKDKKGSSKFIYSIARNIRLLKEEFESLEAGINYSPSEEIKEYETKRMEICNKYCKRDADGKPITTRNEFTFDPEVLKDFNEEIMALVNSHPNVITEKENRQKEIAEFLSEEIPMEVINIPLDEIPDDTFSIDQLNILMDIGIIE